MKTRARGFTLVEIMIGTVIFTIILSTAFMLIIRWNRITSRNEAMTEAMESGREAMDFIEKDLHDAYYIYTYATTTVTGVYVSEPGLPNADLGAGLDALPPIGGVAPPFGGFFNPAVTLDSGANVKTPAGYPAAWTTGNNGLGGLKTDVLTVIATSMTTPIYVCYFRFPGPSDFPAGDTSGIMAPAYRPLWDHLIRLESTCTAQPGGTQGAWYAANIEWDDPSLKYPAGATSSVTFKGSDWSPSSGGSCEGVDDDMEGAEVRVLCPVGNDAAGGTALFDIETPHPYSDSVPTSPYLVNVTLLSGDPNNNLLETGSAAAGVANRRAYGTNALVFPLTLSVFATNVTIPKGD